MSEVGHGQPDEMDIAVHRIVSEELEAVGGSAVAALTQEWSPGGGMFFTSVEPRRPDAASLHVAYEDERTLNLTVGNIWIEIFGKVQDNLGYLREIVAAVLKGDVEEAGSPDNAFGRIHTASGTVHVGAMHLPLPWKLRKRRGYVPYNS